LELVAWDEVTPYCRAVVADIALGVASFGFCCASTYGSGASKKKA